MAKSTKKPSGRKASGKRELIEPNNDKRYVRRDSEGQFSQSDDQSKSLRQDVKKAAKKKVKSGQGDQGDQKKSPAKKQAVKKKSPSNARKKSK